MALSEIWKLVYREYQARLFEYPATSPRTPGPDLPAEYQVRHFTTLAEVPPEAAAVAMPSRRFDLMRGRMRRGRATLLVVFGPKGDVASYCWIQSWKPYASCFANMPRDGRMVGFGWVSPDHRRKGLFTFMCRRAVIYVDPALRPYGISIYGNDVTPRACISAGYLYRGEFRVRRVLWFFQFSRKVSDRSWTGEREGG